MISLTRDNSYSSTDLFDVKTSLPLYSHNVNVIPGFKLPRLSNFIIRSEFNEDTMTEVEFVEYKDNCEYIFQVEREDNRFIYLHFSTMARMFIIFVMLDNKYLVHVSGDSVKCQRIYRCLDTELVRLFKRAQMNMCEKFRIPDEFREMSLFDSVSIMFDVEFVSICQILHVICEDRGYGMSKGYFMHIIYRNVDKIMDVGNLFNDWCYICDDGGKCITMLDSFIESEELFFTARSSDGRIYNSDLLLSVWDGNHFDSSLLSIFFEKMVWGVKKDFLLLHHKHTSEEHFHHRLWDMDRLSLKMGRGVVFRVKYKDMIFNCRFNDEDPIISLLIEQILYVLDLVLKGNVLILSYSSSNRLLNPLHFFVDNIINNYLPYSLLFDLLVKVSVDPIKFKEYIYEECGINIDKKLIFQDKKLSSRDRYKYIDYIFLIDKPHGCIERTLLFVENSRCVCDFCLEYDCSADLIKCNVKIQSYIDRSKFLYEQFDRLINKEDNVWQTKGKMIDIIDL